MADDDVQHARNCFYINGRYQALTYAATDKQPKTMVEQMYIEELKPAQITQQWPIIFWHGMCQTGMSWITTPDGRPGWASYFLAHGYIVYVVDIPERGRSAYLPNSSKLVSIAHDYVENFWTATASNGGLWPQAELQSQWPGTGKLGDPVFDQFMASQVQGRNDYLAVENLSRDLGVKLLEKVGPAILCTHSQGGGHGWLIADKVPHLVKAVVALEPVGPPFVNRVASVVKPPDSAEIRRPYGITMAPTAYEPPLAHPTDLTRVLKDVDDKRLCQVILQAEPARQLVNLAKVPTCVVTSESGYHAYYDHATVAYLRQAGVEVTWLNLPEHGITGNGHFMFIEKNNWDVAELVQKWLLGLSPKTK